ncbi:MAG TPA: NTP transferase domain-containing protein, partial [Blastocatellia bacterium]|nr:NTP transferase domain-containing protein [Blastocatellia bacterium]
MKGIILAAGKGLRLNGVAGATPKCLMEVGGITLIERQIQAFKASGIDDLAVVVGFEAERVRAACGPEVRFVENTRFDETNSMYSLWLARDLLVDG